MTPKLDRPAEILLIEYNLADVELTREAMTRIKSSCNLTVVNDGEKATTYLRRQSPYVDAVRPDLVLLDLNLPRMNGREVLTAIKSDKHLQVIRVIVFTTSTREVDIITAYKLSANAYITKLVTFDGLLHVIQTLDHFWFNVVVMPPGTDG